MDHCAKNNTSVPSSRVIGWLACAPILFLAGCGGEPPLEHVQDETTMASLSDFISSDEVWEGSSAQMEESFLMKDGLFSKKEGVPFSGTIKIRARNGSLTALRNYSGGRKDGDFLEWHETGSLKSKSQYQFGSRHGYFYVWTKDGKIYSRRYFQDDLEDFGRFEDQGASESGRSLAALELETWEGSGPEFYQKFAGDPKRGGLLHIRETEELYTGTITALDDQGRKEAVLRFSKGKYHGTISKWNEAGSLWEEAEFDRGDLVQFSIKNGKPFDPSQIIDLSQDSSKIDLLFKD